MIWYWIAGILAVIALGLLVFNFTRERRYLKKRTSEAMSRKLWTEIEEEREAALKRKHAFEDAMNDVSKKPPLD